MQQKATPRAIKSAHTRQAILEAAKELLFEYGYENTSIQQICQAAHVSVGTFYHFFPSKHDLLMSVTSRVAGVSEKWDSFDFEKDSPDKLAENYSRRTAEIVKLLSPDVLYKIYFPNTGGNIFFFTKEHPTYQYLYTALEGFQKSGKLRGDLEVKQMLKELLGCHFGVFYTAYTTNSMETFQETLETILKRMISAYMAP